MTIQIHVDTVVILPDATEPLLPTDAAAADQTLSKSRSTTRLARRVARR